MAATVSDLTIYPIKSTAGLSLSHCAVEPEGIAFDRRFVITDPDGRFITGRTEPRLAQVRCALTADGLRLSADGQPDLLLRYAAFGHTYLPISIWGDTVHAKHCHPDYDQWFSTLLQRPCQLMFLGDQSHRPIQDHNSTVSFADGYPLLLISEASLAELNRSLPTPVTMARFRTNITAAGTEAFAEDRWKTIRIGTVIFDLVKPCSRCVFTTLNPATGQFDDAREPLRTLARFRQGSNGEVYFGQNLIPRNSGIIQTGDPIEVLETGAAPAYPDNRSRHPDADETAPPSAQLSSHPSVKLNFESWQQRIDGDTERTLLEQGEAAGLRMASNCRAGLCGTCKVQVVEGEYQLTADGPLTEADHNARRVLACSCIPRSDMVIRRS